MNEIKMWKYEYNEKGRFTGKHEELVTPENSLRDSIKKFEKYDMIKELINKYNLYFLNDDTNDYQLENHLRSFTCFSKKNEINKERLDEIFKKYGFECDGEPSFIEDKTYVNMVINPEDKYKYFDSFTLICLKELQYEM